MVGFTVDLYPLCSPGNSLPPFCLKYPINVLATMFEQYLTLKLNPNINGSVLSSIPNVVVSAQTRANMIASKGVPLYVYCEGVLVHKFLSLIDATILLKVAKS